MSLPMIEFARHSDCSKCKLSESATNRGLPTRISRADRTPGLAKALLIVGKAPAAIEDESADIMLGPNGQLLEHGYVRPFRLNALADVYYTNVVRCRLPKADMAVGKRCFDACKDYLTEDLQKLTRLYAEVVILTLGESAKTLTGKAVGLGKFHQGQMVELLDGHPMRMFSTYMPAALDKDPGKVTAVGDHLTMLVRYLHGGELPRQLVRIDALLGVPEPTGEQWSLDIETYGAFERTRDGRELPRQRFFHPAKCMAMDGVAKDDLIQTVGLSQGPGTARVSRNGYAEEWQAVRGWLRDWRGRLLGQNVPFDVVNCRAAFDELHVWTPQTVTLVDLAVLNFLHSDKRPERSLKRVSKLLGIADYDDDEVQLGRGDRYASVDDALAIDYNAKDCLATWMSAEELEKRLAMRGQRWDVRWYSDALWLCVYLMEAGVEYSRDALSQLMVKAEDDLQSVVERGALLGVKLQGKDSMKWRREWAKETAKELGLVGDRRLKTTGKTAIVSTDQDNRELFREEAEANPSVFKDELGVLDLMDEHNRHAKLLSSYLRPMLGQSQDERKVGSSLVGNRAWPTWFCIRTSGDRDADADAGQTQARFSAKGPAVATTPESVEKCERSRFPGGYLVYCDESQVELRVQGAMSGDEKMIDDYVAGRSRHAETAALLAGRPVTKEGDPELYAAGKEGNFLMSYRGGPRRLVRSWRTKAGLILSLDVADRFIYDYTHRHDRWHQWQEEMLDRAQKEGFLEVPHVGLRQTFLGSVRAVYTTKVCNFFPQATAAILTQSAQFDACMWIRKEGLRTVFFKNTYDEGGYDCPPDEVSLVSQSLPEFYRNPSILRVWRESGFFDPRMPFDCSLKIVEPP